MITPTTRFNCIIPAKRKDAPPVAGYFFFFFAGFFFAAAFFAFFAFIVLVLPVSHPNRVRAVSMWKFSDESTNGFFR
ncbi:MAG TPA: hypothetical protein VFR73_21185 [Hyphomicrobiaceae bacterium]|jgi:hypothetical protein|nr:hypothetical protein [Hyphomicrobiaceae bacterium]HEX2338063.1 hypothetical protein [Hyphomicrobiaceae bacterium]